MTATISQESYIPEYTGPLEPSKGVGYSGLLHDKVGLLYDRTPQAVKNPILNSNLYKKLQENEHIKIGVRNLYRFLKENKFELSHASYNTFGMAFLDWGVTGLGKYATLPSEVFWAYQIALNFVIRPFPIYFVTYRRRKKKKPLKLTESSKTHLYSMPGLDFLWHGFEGNGIPRKIWTPFNPIPSELFISMFEVPAMILQFRKPIKRAMGRIITEGYDITDKKLTQFLKNRSVPTSQFFKKHVISLFDRD